MAGGIIDSAPAVAALVDGAPAGRANSAPDRDRARGVLLGLAAGNLLGLEVEGMSAREIAERFPGGVRGIDRRELDRPLDDDLAQALDLGKALLGDALQGGARPSGDPAADFAERLIRWRRVNGRGIGLTTSAVIDALEDGAGVPGAAERIWKQRGGIAPNGGLMRCAPVALRHWSDGAALVRASAETCAVTHYAAACQWSCILLNAAVAILIRGGDASVEALREAAGADGAGVEIGERLAGIPADVEELRPDEGLIGHTLLALQIGLWPLASGTAIEEGLIRIVNAGGDTDTNGAIAGAVLGAREGSTAIPERWLERIPRREEIAGLADRLTAAP